MGPGSREKGQGERAMVGVGLEDEGRRREGVGCAELEEDALGLLPHDTCTGRGSV